MSVATNVLLKLHLKHLHAKSAVLKTAQLRQRSCLVLGRESGLSLPSLRYFSGVAQHHLSRSHRHHQNRRAQSCWYSSDVENRTDNTYALTEDACPQGIQGDNCETFKLWLESCQRYGLESCSDQLQGIQSGRRTLAEVIAEQDKFIAEVAEQYHAAAAANGRREHENSQGTQDFVTAAVKIDTPCPQGVQGSDCARFRLWLENCHRFGLHDCTENFEKFRAGKKSLVEIFAEQDQMIREATKTAFQKTSKKQHREYSTSTKSSNKQHREYSTSAKNSGPENSDKPGTGAEGEVQLTQRQKLKRAVKEYGSTVIVFHVTISLMSLGFFYLLVSSGIDIVGLLMKLGVGGTLLENKLAAGTGTFVVAYAVHKVFAPVRIATTLTATPFIVRYLRRVGFLKVPEQLKSKQ